MLEPLKNIVLIKEAINLVYRMSEASDFQGSIIFLKGRNKACLKNKGSIWKLGKNSIFHAALCNVCFTD